MLDGAITVVVGDERVEVGAGGFVWLPRDVPHTFRVDSETAHLYEFVTPAGVEEFHRAASDPAQTPTLPPPSAPDIARLADAASGFDIDLVGPPLVAG